MNSFSRKTMILTATAALGACGLFAAVTETRHMGRHGRSSEKMAVELGLTQTQQAQAKAIFQNERQSARPILQQLRQERQAVHAAVKAGKSDTEIQQLAKAEAPELGQLAALRASASAKFYSMLTPQQQQKLDAMRHSRHTTAESK